MNDWGFFGTFGGFHYIHQVHLKRSGPKKIPQKPKQHYPW